MKTYRSILLLLAAVGMTACEKNAVQEDEVTSPVAGNARVRFFHFGVNAPGVYFFANDEKLTAVAAVSGAESTTGITYTNVGSAGLYSAIAPGQVTLSARIAATTDNGLPIATLSPTLEADKSYSFYMSGLYDATAKRSDAFIVEDVIPAFDYTSTCVRFVNAIHNSQPMALYIKDPNSTAAEVKIGSEVAYKAATAFVCVPPGQLDLAVRVAGSTTNAIARTGSGFSPGRVYTITARGDMTVTSTTATNRPFLDITANR